eukprot:scaffold1421_cov255-Pinguiococcus_pyrenoidosus.AAC.9
MPSRAQMMLRSALYSCRLESGFIPAALGRRTLPRLHFGCTTSKATETPETTNSAVLSASRDETRRSCGRYIYSAAAPLRSLTRACTQGRLHLVRVRSDHLHSSRPSGVNFPLPAKQCGGDGTRVG